MLEVKVLLMSAYERVSHIHVKFLIEIMELPQAKPTKQALFEKVKKDRSVGDPKPNATITLKIFH